MPPPPTPCCRGRPGSTWPRERDQREGVRRQRGDGALLRVSGEAAGARARWIPVMPDRAIRDPHRLNHWPFRT
eukprot:3896944-Pyramimonas_sp.AAC.1